MKKFLFMALSLAFLIGCASPKYNYRPSATNISEPPLNSIVTVYVGDSIVRQGKYVQHDAIYLKNDTKVGGLGSYTFTRGYYLKKGEDWPKEFYLPADGPDSGKVIRGAFTDQFQVIQIDHMAGQFCGVSVFNGLVCTTGADYEKRKYPIATADSFQQTLIYSGRVGNKINIGYREFSNNFARPAYNNDVEYDLSESKTIGYKGCRIEIIEATNEYIKCKVIRNFNKAAY